MPQSLVAANPWHQEEAERDNNQHAQNKQTHLKYEKKGKRKAQGVPQPQTAAPPRPQEEVEIDKSKQAQNEQTYEKHQD